MSKKIQSTSGISRVAIKRRIGLIALLILVAGSLSYPSPANWLIDQTNSAIHTHFGHIDKPFILGLDLQGGTRLEYEADVSRVGSADQAGAVEGVRDVIERRVNAMGVSEPVVQTTRTGNSWRVSAELAGISDINQAIKMIGETPILEFKEQDTSPPRELTPDEQKQINDSADQAKKDADAFLNQVKDDPQNFLQKVTNLGDKVIHDRSGDIGFIKDKPEYQSVLDIAKFTDAGSVVPVSIPTYGAVVVAKVVEKKEAGQEVQAAHILIQYAGSQSASSSTTRTKEEALALTKKIRSEVTAENFNAKAKQYSEEPNADKSGGDLGWFGQGVMVDAFDKAVFTMKKGDISDPVETPFGYHIIYLKDTRPQEDIHVQLASFKKLEKTDIIPPSDGWKRTDLTGKQLASAQLEFDPRSGAAEVGLQFNDEGAKLFADITKRNVGKPVAIFLDNQPISIPTVQTEILGGKAVITGQFSVAEAKLLAQRLQAGALPVPIKLIMQQSVGPSLGKSSVHASMVAGLWGFLLVAFFMIIIYRIPGVLSVLSLGVYALVLFAVFKLIPVTLTLSGIAGLILSVGMAVDANVLIFERLKEELRLGKAYVVAVEEAFKRAWPSIRDGNITTLIACIVLYWFTSSIIKGFALTLGLGVILSMFSAITVTRNLLRFIALPKLTQSAGWLFLKPKSKPENNQTANS